METRDRSLGCATNKPVKKKKKVRAKENASEEVVVVGLERDVGIIRDKLVQDHKQLDVVSIVGMGGMGKTTLAAKVFNDPFVVYHFHVRAWVTISQTYERKDLLAQILGFMDVGLDLASASYSRLHEVLHKSLTRKRYLIVGDDIWSNEAWDDLKLFFPDDDTGSRVLVTSRVKEVALHARPRGLIHQLGCLADEQCWELLCKRVFRGVDCPEWLEKAAREDLSTKMHQHPRDHVAYSHPQTSSRMTLLIRAVQQSGHFCVSIVADP